MYAMLSWGQETRGQQRIKQGEVASFFVNGQALTCTVVEPQGVNDPKWLLLLPDQGIEASGSFSLIDSLQEAGFKVIVPQGLEMRRAHVDYIQSREKLLELIQELKSRERKPAMVVGVGTGGDMAFDLATKSRDVSVTFVFYASPSVKASEYSRIQGPIFGFYGAEDTLTATLSHIGKYMRANGKIFQPEIYEEASHGLLDKQPTTGDKIACEASMNRLFALIRKY